MKIWKHINIMMHTMPWWGKYFDEALATCNWLPSVLDNGFCSLNASVNEDILENGKEQVNKDHEECSKGSLQTCHTPMSN